MTFTDKFSLFCVAVALTLIVHYVGAKINRHVAIQREMDRIEAQFKTTDNSLLGFTLK